MFSLQTKMNIARAILTKKNPYYIQYYVNGQCNLMCKQCNIVETNSGLKEMTIDEIKIVASNIKKIGGGIVLLTGGEPFLRKDLDQVAKCFIDEGLNVRLQTAGIATEEQLQKCYDVGGRDLNISLDSLDSNKQDYINSVPGSWAKAIEAIGRVSKVFGNESAICSFGCVMSRFNYKEIPAILEFATKIGWYLSLVPVHITALSDYKGFRSYDDDFKFREEDFPEVKKVLQKIIQMKREGHLLFDSERFLWSAFNFSQTGKPTWRKKDMCDSPNLYFAVRPNGDFTTCCDYILNKTYSLKDPGFAQYYKERKVHALAEPIVKNCKGCHYGSYPEVTISVRDGEALFERVKMVLFREKRIINRFQPEELFDIAENVRGVYPEIYANGAHVDTNLSNKLERWRDPATRRAVIKEDMLRRKDQGRIRKAPKENEEPKAKEPASLGGNSLKPKMVESQTTTDSGMS